MALADPYSQKHKNLVSVTDVWLSHRNHSLLSYLLVTTHVLFK